MHCRHWKKLPYQTLDSNTSVPHICHLTNFLVTITKNDNLGNKLRSGHYSGYRTNPCKWNIRERTRERKQGETEEHNNEAQHTKTLTEKRPRTKFNPSRHSAVSKRLEAGWAPGLSGYRGEEINHCLYQG